MEYPPMGFAMVHFPMHSVPMSLLSMDLQNHLGAFQQFAGHGRASLLALQAGVLGWLERLA
ncbi:MAG: hypothetical protein DMG36_23050 [Acidobacteria bacterium]|nr:MAG: hypothetical protein DMG36_23050 [Acidobacteriota bacterium]